MEAMAKTFIRICVLMPERHALERGTPSRPQCLLYVKPDLILVPLSATGGGHRAFASHRQVQCVHGVKLSLCETQTLPRPPV